MEAIVSKRLSNTAICEEIVVSMLKNFTGDVYKIKEEIVKYKSELIEFVKNYNNTLSGRSLLIEEVFGGKIGKEFCEKNLQLQAIDLLYIFSVLHQMSLELKDAYDPTKNSLSAFNSRKIKGCFYTPYEIAYYITKESMLNFLNTKNKPIKELKILEPCVGTGIFVVALVDCLMEDSDLRKYVKNKEDIVHLIEYNLTCVDIDIEALGFYKNYMPFHLSYYYIMALGDLGNKVYHDNILLSDSFINKFNDYYDIIFFNPPYELLKPNSNEFRYDDGIVDQEAFNYHHSKTQSIKKQLKENNIYEYSRNGMLNLYKFFIELTIKKLSANGASIGFIVPLTILGDYQCRDLRKYLLSRNGINSVVIIPEKNKFFNGVIQAFTILNITKGNHTQQMAIKGNVSSTKDLFLQPSLTVHYDSLKKISFNEIITPLNDLDVSVIDKLSTAHKIGDLSDCILNLRGEIDLTKYKPHITASRIGTPLIRGCNIGYYQNITGNCGQISCHYIDDRSFKKSIFDSKIKLSHSLVERIACPQISNLRTAKRLKFSYLRKGNYLGNSCNYLLISKKEELDTWYGITYESLLCLLNSSIYNYIFKLTSTNNHISNNQINDLPILLSKEKKWLYVNLKNIFMKYVNGYIDIDETEIFVDAHVFCLYEIKPNQIRHVLNNESRQYQYIERVLSLKERLKDALIYNHQVSSLSEMDIEMIRSIPPGGNWKNIPESIPSKRLEQIRRSGGRTTLYGRLERDLPSYTISTYFNRPGNGTFIHPDYYHDNIIGYTQNRLISHREAARLQSFKDTFIFKGGKGSVLKQIGNAVPPLLSYHLAKSISQYMNKADLKVVDLFCGAGGLSIGFKEAGYAVVLAIDNDKKAIETFQMNHEETYTICGDIEAPNIKSMLYGKIEGVDVDIIIGGPPCQGYSHAGLRVIDDPRNLLFREFVSLVEKKKPSMFLIENVVGLLSINSGKTYKSIISCFAEIGYEVIGATLNAAEYGVPQRRKRVFIIGSRFHIDDRIFPKPSFSLPNSTKAKQLSLFEPFSLPSAITVEEAISDLPFIINDFGNYEVATPFPWGFSEYQAYMKGLISYERFYELKKKSHSNCFKMELN